MAAHIASDVFIDAEQLRREFARAVADARSREACGSSERGLGFGDGWASVVDGVDCYVFPMFNVELGELSKFAPLGCVWMMVMITDPKFDEISKFGISLCEQGWSWRLGECLPDPIALFERAFDDAVVNARGNGEFVFRRDAVALRSIPAPGARGRLQSL